MRTIDVIRRVVDVLEQHGVPYLLVGSYATNIYGEPRNTHDLDIVVELSNHSIHAVVRDLGPEFRFDPQKRFEGVTATLRFVIEVGRNGFKIEFFELTDDPHDRERFSRGVRRHLEAFGRDVVVQSLDDVVVNKLRWTHLGGRLKDEDDLRKVILVSGDDVNWNYVHLWADEHGTRELLDEIRASLPDID